MTPAFTDGAGRQTADNSYRPGYGRGYTVLLNVSNGAVYETNGNNFRPFLSENKTNVINVHWYQYGAQGQGVVLPGQATPAGTLFANWSLKTSAPRNFFLTQFQTSTGGPLDLNTGLPSYYYLGSEYISTTATLAGSTASFSLFANSPYTITSCRIAARPEDALLAPYAFNVAATVTTTSLVAANQICTSAPAPAIYTGVFPDGFLPRVTFTVTQFSQDLLDRSAAQIRAQGAGNIPLRAQIQTVVSPISPYNPNWTGVATTPFWIYPSVITLLSDHFPLTFAAPLTRPAYYGA